LKETNPVLKKMAELRQAYDESENPVVSSMRSVTETIGSWLDENETAQVMRLMKNMDQDFNRESFERELREYIVPEIVDAYLSADQEALKAWCGEAVSLFILFLINISTIFFRRTTSFGQLWSTS
jgi:import inner membrane translocase subunit TIM44